VKQLFVRDEHRQPRNAQVRGERPRRRQPLSRAQHAIHDGPAQAVINLAMQWHAAPSLDWKERQQLRACRCSHLAAFS